MFKVGDCVRVRPDIIYKKKYSTVYTNLNMFRLRGLEFQVERVVFDHASRTYRYFLKGCWELWGFNHLERVTHEFATDYDDVSTIISTADLMSMLCCVGM